MFIMHIIIVQYKQYSVKMGGGDTYLMNILVIEKNRKH